MARESKARIAGAADKISAEEARKEAKARAKAEARQARNAAQAEEEARTWGEIRARADIVVKAKRGAPAYVWTQEIEHELLDRLSNGQSLTYICALPHMPTTPTVYKRIEESPSFALAYSHARGNFGSVLFDQCLAIADDDSGDIIETPDGPQVNHAKIQRDKLRIETRFRMAGKFNAALSDKAALPSSVTVNHNTVQIDGRTLDVSQREQLRAMLLDARASMAKPINEPD